jgi:hypothetical protein
MRDQLYVALDALGGLPPQVLNAVAEQVLAGLVLVVQRCRDIIRLVLFVNEFGHIEVQAEHTLPGPRQNGHLFFP